MAALLPLVASAFILVTASADCYNNCMHLRLDHGFLVKDDGTKVRVTGRLSHAAMTPPPFSQVFVGTNWSSVQRLLAQRLAPVSAALPGLDANASTMRVLRLVQP